MIDYNFFENYEVKKVKKSPSIQVAMFLYIIVLLIAVAFIGRNYIVLVEKQTKSDLLSAELLQLKSYDSIARILEKQTLEIKLKGIVRNLDAAHEGLMNNGSVNENMIALLVDAMPKDVELSEFSIADNQILANGLADSKPAIAEFEYNLREMSAVENVSIGSIRREDDSFSFDISIGLRVGGDGHEN